MRPFLLSILLILMSDTASAQSFRESQQKFDRVATAYRDKGAVVDSLLKTAGISKEKCEILIRGFKREMSLEVWGRNRGERSFRLIVSYPFCALSGELGPKRKEGDLQVPEGVYSINHFNPQSSYFLSLGISYPNASDSVRGTKGKLGGEIYIHGNCVTVGCIPITDELIKELYVIAVEARTNGQEQIPVLLFPFRMTDAAMKEQTAAVRDPGTLTLWNELKPVFDRFESTHELPAVTIDNSGRYSIQ